MPQRSQRARAASPTQATPARLAVRSTTPLGLTTLIAVTAACVAAGAVSGCSSHPKRTTSVAPSFSLISSPPTPTTSPGPGNSSAIAPSEPTAGVSGGSTGPTGGGTTPPTAPIQPVPPTVTPTGASPVPCPIPSPQTLVEGSSAKTAGSGDIAFTFVTEQRMCGHGGAVSYVSTTKAPTTATIAPAATIFVLPPGGNGDLLQIPAAAFPDALKAGSKPAYFAIVYGGAAGSISQIVQYAAPHA